MTASTWRIAAGTCVIVVGVLVAGGPIARADSDSAPSQASGGSSAGGNEQPSQPASTTKATKEAKATKTQKSLERLVEERVQSRVEEFIAKTADPEKRTTRRRGGGNKSNAAKLDELNASMRNAVYSR